MNRGLFSEHLHQPDISMLALRWAIATHLVPAQFRSWTQTANMSGGSSNHYTIALLIWKCIFYKTTCYAVINCEAYSQYRF